MVEVTMGDDQQVEVVDAQLSKGRQHTPARLVSRAVGITTVTSGVDQGRLSTGPS
jgi:hypothetical protein